MTNFEAITKDPETLATAIADAANDIARKCGRGYDKEESAKNITAWLNKPAITTKMTASVG